MATGEVVFNTALAGYQEILTDPSYAGQIITFTYPHIGNYGVNERDDEARAPRCRGVIVRDLARRPSNWRATDDLDGFLRRHEIAGIAGIDTRRLTRHIRSAGAMPGRVRDRRSRRRCSRPRRPTAAPTAAISRRWSPPRSRTRSAPTTRRFFVVAYDFGIKRSILDQLVGGGLPGRGRARGHERRRGARRARPTACSSRTVPATRPRSPARATSVRELLGNVPGVRHLPRAPDHEPRARRARRSSCASAITAATIRCGTSRPAGSRSRARTTTTRSTRRRCPRAAWSSHLNLNDGDVEGVRSDHLRAFSVQYHPEAGPGPHDARYLFEEFTQLMKAS